MSPVISQLVDDVTALTGAATPSWLEADAPLLSADALDITHERDFYLIGLIGGKDVGKSALVNALVGQSITAQTSYGPGTETVIAYAHQRQADSLKQLLESTAAGQYKIITHQLSGLERQVLLDLPDIDSHFVSHVKLTRQMLRHLLFPVWVQSVEKYADRQPQEMLRQVAAGNAPENFVFCLNKSDQIAAGHHPQGKNATGNGQASPALAELGEDYAGRIQKLLGLKAQPKVWMISAIRPAEFDLPRLRALLSQQKSTADVQTSKKKAERQQDASALRWIESHDLPARAQRLARLQESAEELVTERLGLPLLDGVVPRLIADPLHKASILDQCVSRRISRWPVLNILHGIFAAIGGLIRRNAEPRARPVGAEPAEVLVDHHLATMGDNSTAAASAADAPTRTLSGAIQAVFAHLQQSQPQVSKLYRERKLWEAMPADLAAGELRQTLTEAIDQQRKQVAERLSPGHGGAAAIRWLLTIGAIVWFAILQPLLWAFLQQRHTSMAAPSAPYPGVLDTAVNMLGIDYLLRIISFLLIYFIILWLILRWDTRRRLDKVFRAWSADDRDGPVRRTIQWLDSLTAPIASARTQVEQVVTKIEAAREATETSVVAGKKAAG